MHIILYNLFRFLLQTDSDILVVNKQQTLINKVTYQTTICDRIII